MITEKWDYRMKCDEYSGYHSNNACPRCCCEIGSTLKIMDVEYGF